MVPNPSWSTVARLARVLTPAGPRVAPTTAQATVARLRRGALWAEPLLAGISGLPEAAAAVSAADVLVVDRHGLLTVVGRLASRFLGSECRPAGPGSWGLVIAGRMTPLGLAGSLLAMHTVAARSVGLWDPYARRRVLVASNTLEAAERGALDQSDYCRWVALRAGLWGVMFEEAPWLRDHLSHLARQLPATAHDLARLVLLLDGMADAQMDALTPADIPSVRWIRRNGPELGGVAALRVLPRVGIGIGRIEELRATVTVFCGTVAPLAGLPVLLRSRDHLPTRDEVEHPRAWMDRVGI